MPLILVRVGLRSFFTGEHTWADFVEFMLFFIIGFILPADTRLDESIKAHGRICLILGIAAFGTHAAFILGLEYNYPSDEPFVLTFVLFEPLMSIGRWSWIVVVLSLGSSYLNINKKALTYANEAVTELNEKNRRRSMHQSYEFLSQVLDTITEHIVVIDRTGRIVFVNRSWNVFSRSNNCLIDSDWDNVNYLSVCDKAAAMGDDFGRKAAEGIRNIINTEEKIFYFEYPCHSPDEKRWFMMRTTEFSLQDNAFFVISHQKITERKLAEEAVANLSRIDGLTNIANRRTFDEFLNNEWRRCARLKMPVSLAIIDIDHFKLLNDTYGHQAGDECLKKIGATLRKFTNRPGDICARYGGEEFAIVYGDTTLENARVLVKKVLEAIRGLKIPNKKSPTKATLTASIGLACNYPNNQNNEQELIKAADTLLYTAKENGRNQVRVK